VGFSILNFNKDIINNALPFFL